VVVANKDQKSSYVQAEMMNLLQLAESMIADELRRLMENLS
jgi:hypothetical protein